MKYYIDGYEVSKEEYEKPMPGYHSKIATFDDGKIVSKTTITRDIWHAYKQAKEKHPAIVTPAVRMLTIMEEVGEVAQAIQDGSPAEIRAEVLDAIAVLVRLYEEV